MKNHKLRFLSVQGADLDQYSLKLQELEKEFCYPFGDEFFRIDHGRNYFNFFRAIGKPTFKLALFEDRIVGCGAGVWRQIPHKNGFIDAWYLCDLKVSRDFQNYRIPKKLLMTGLFLDYIKCQRGYAISMNPAHGTNRIVTLLSKHFLLPFKQVGTLNFYSLSYAEIMRTMGDDPIFFSDCRFKNISDCKDLVMMKSGLSRPLLHFTAKDLQTYTAFSPTERYTHLFCCIEGSEKNHFFQHRFSKSGSASIIGHRMNHIDWSFIETSEI
ncbi:MAG: hypothetical protein NT027_19010 [Proteobacteria bacterium]|nr:hypothetical protein [Pseudomonadota bacterium]